MTNSHEQNEERESAGLVRCDRQDCVALATPHSAEELRLAYDHWKNHHYMHGCSHGR